MSVYEWRFRLDGDEFDIKCVTDLFSSEIKIIADEHGHYQLVVELKCTPDELQTACATAQELLAKLNAIAHVMYENHDNLRIVGVGCKDSSGASMQLFVQVGSAIRGRSRMGGSISVTNSNEQTEFASPPNRIGDQFFNAADSNEHLERALYLFGSLPLDWKGLYMVLEAAKDAHGGWANLVAKDWVRHGLISDFKATANSYKALRLEARHGSIKNTDIDAPKLTLTEARDMVRTILEKWLKASISAPT